MYIHLISNASADIFPNNTISDFSTALATPVPLTDQEWEAGLCEVHIPFAIDNLPPSDAYFEVLEYNKDPTAYKLEATVETLVDAEKYGCIFRYSNGRFEVNVPDGTIVRLESDTRKCGLPPVIGGVSNRTMYGDETTECSLGKIEIYKDEFKLHKIKIASGYYESVEVLIKAINKATKDFELIIDDEYVSVTTLAASRRIRFPDRIANILGMRDDDHTPPTSKARHLPDLFPGTNCFMIYCDFIANAHVGDGKLPLLRALPFNPAKRHEIVSFNCFPVQYKKVVLSELHTIRFLTSDDSGQDLHFDDRNRLVATLHLRRRRRRHNSE